MSVVTRFAPSPTGSLHLGNARTALFSFLHAHRYGGAEGRFVLRIEDTDAARSHAHFTTGLIEDLQWLGLSWDGEPLHQSARLPIYAEQLARLTAAGRAYPCFCTPEELQRARASQRAAGKPPRYDGRCSSLSAADVQARITRGDPAALRFRVPPGRRVEFTDLVHGAQSFATDDIGDFVLQRADGSPAFFFSNAVDDALGGITHVLRGEDHLTNTPRQLLVLEALQLPPPAYGHLPLLLDAADAPLSKRTGSASLAALRAQGYLPEAVRNHLFRLGHYTPRTEALTPGEMVAAYDAAHLQRAAAHFDAQQLAYWQKECVHRLDVAAVAAWLAPLLPSGLDPLRARQLVAALQPNVVLPADAREWIDVVLGPAPDVPELRRAAITEAGTAFFAAAAAAAREHGNDYARIVEAARNASGRKGAALFVPLRLALTGRDAGPELKALLAVMPDGTASQRLARFA